MEALIVAAVVGVVSSTLGYIAGIFVSAPPRPATPKHTIIPGCRYLLPDGLRVQVTSVDASTVHYGLLSDGNPIMWHLDAATFTAHARMVPRPDPAPEGAVSLAGPGGVA